MKLEGLKELVKEELKRALGDFQNVPFEELEAGTYTIEYITQNPDGGGADIDGKVTKSFTKEDFLNPPTNLPSNFWKGIAQDAADKRIYKIDKVTKA
jgi:hypothetical protein